MSAWASPGAILILAPCLRASLRRKVPKMRLIPRKLFLTRGVGVHREKLTSFEMALREASIAHFNLVRVSSIFPPRCQIVTKEEGLPLLQAGEIVFAVLAEMSTNE